MLRGTQRRWEALGSLLLSRKLRPAEPLAQLTRSVIFGVGSWSMYSLLRWVGLADRLILE